MEIEIVIPAKNEENNIGQVLEKASKLGLPIYVIDGKSTDRTREKAEKMGAQILVQNGDGKGDALRSAIDRLKGDIVVFMDADGSHDPADIDKLTKPIENGQADMVIGSRMLGGTQEFDGRLGEYIRFAGSALSTVFICWRLGIRLSETQNGFRAIRTEALKKLDLTENSTAIEQEMIAKAVCMGFRVTEAPVHEYKRISGETRVLLRKAIWPHIVSLIKILACGPGSRRIVG